MANDTYLKIESNAFPYYFGNDFLLNIGTYDFVKLNCVQEEVVKCSDGGKTYSEIYYYIIDKFGQADNDNTRMIFEQLVKKLCENKLIKQIHEKDCEELKYAGEKGKTYPWWLLVELTNSCNMRCRHCYKEAETFGTMLDYEMFEKIVLNFKKRTPKMVLTGGEPLLNPYINEILKMSEDNFDTYLLTNASLLDKIRPEYLIGLKQVQISLYGYDEEYFCMFTGQKLYNKTIENIKYAVQYLGKNVIVTVIVTKNNLMYLENYIANLISLGVKSMMFGLAVPLGRMAENKQEFSFSDYELMSLCNLIRDYRYKYSKQIQIAPFMDIKKVEVRKKTDFGCHAGKYNIAITEKGMVVPCHMMSREAFCDYSYDDYIEDVNNGKVRTYKDAINKISDILTESNSKLSDIYCNGFCDVRR